MTTILHKTIELLYCKPFSLLACKLLFSSNPRMSSSQSNKLKLVLLNICFLFLLSFYLQTSSVYDYTNSLTAIPHTTKCDGLHLQPDYQSKCLYLQTHIGCRPKGYINYLQLFYCTCGQYPLLGNAIFLLWLLLLFYLLGDTAANYFCSSLECLSTILNLSPAIAGVTLLSLGNGAADVFASVVSFTKSSDGDFGLNCILGGSFFVSSVVVGVISIVISPRDQFAIDKTSFVRDVIFFVFSLSSLLVIICVGRISLWGSLCFVSIYPVYVCTVCATHYFFNKNDRITNGLSHGSNAEEFGETGVPLLGYVDDDDDEKHNLVEKGGTVTESVVLEETPSRFYGLDSSTFYYMSKILYLIELPLSLPRRLSIPVISEEGWSKPYAVISVAVSPVLIVAICGSQTNNLGPKMSLAAYMIAGFVGLVLGNLAFATTKWSSPPKKCLIPWLAGGFLMSVTWTYIIAAELVSLLVAIGNIIGISPSILGLTVLAWGNSLADMITNVSMAKDGGADGAQIAISGCYAGPMFNTLVGLGLPFVLSSWSEYPSSYVIPVDTSLYDTLGFFIASLLWALFILPKSNMKLDKSLGIGLLAIYLCFLFLRLAKALGVMNF